MVKYIITDTLSKGLDFYIEGDPENNIDIIAVSYTHLDVYKRQGITCLVVIIKV